MKKYICGFFCALLLAGTILTVTAEDTQQDELLLYAKAAVLMDAQSGRILYAKNGNEQLPMASTTKIMTCIVALEAETEEKEVKVSAYAASMPAVKLGVKKGERYLLKDLYYSLMLESHNDAAVVIAEAIGTALWNGEQGHKPLETDCSLHSREESLLAVECYVRKMNEKAKELGCENTCFLTPNGLDEEREAESDGGTVKTVHSTTAAELARMMAYCIGESDKCSDFLEITGTPQYVFRANNRTYSLQNHNSFLGMMEGALSGKTGFTGNAGYCYVGALKRDNRTFIVALLACGWPNHRTWKWKDTGKLMQYGLDHYEYRGFSEESVLFPQDKLPKLTVVNGVAEDLSEEAVLRPVILRKKGEKPEGILLREGEEITISIQLPQALQAPVKAGEKIGEIDYLVDGEVYRREEIISDRDILKITFAYCLQSIITHYLI